MNGFIAGTETLQEGMSVTPVTLESVTYFGNATATFVRNQDSVRSGNRSAYGVIAAAGMMNRPSHFYSLGLGQLLLGAGAWGGDRLQTPIPMHQHLCGCGGSFHSLTQSICLFPTVVLSAGLVAATLLVLSRLLYPPGLLMAMKESLLLSERKTSPL